uniref:Pentatricopeptide repeat-containing protein n=1 Tax=Tanacetum cinerariifolium TaxID=118510 RepID=A0A6L2KVV3_TANCI|nr:hypothetical protein [Tanacetum cinerariifolium]
MFIEFVIQNQLFSYSLEEFAQILDIPCEGACMFTDKWSLDELAYGVPTDGPYQTNPLFPDEIITYILNDQEGGNRDHVPACLCYMLSCVARSEKFNLAYYMAKLTERVIKQSRLIVPYGMLLTRLFKFVMSEIHKLLNESYVLYDRVMNPLTTQQERKTRLDHDTRRGRHFTSSSFAFNQPSSSHLNDDDDDDGNDEGTSRTQDEHHGGLRSIEKGLKNLWRNIKKDEMNLMFAHIEYLFTSTMNSLSTSPLKTRPYHLIIGHPNPFAQSHFL